MADNGRGGKAKGEGMGLAAQGEPGLGLRLCKSKPVAGLRRDEQGQPDAGWWAGSTAAETEGGPIGWGGLSSKYCGQLSHWDQELWPWQTMLG